MTTDTWELATLADAAIGDVPTAARLGALRHLLRLATTAVALDQGIESVSHAAVRAAADLIEGVANAQTRK